MRTNSPLLLALLALAGCSVRPALQPVKVAVPVECRASTPARPAMPTEALPPAPVLDAFVRAAAAEIELREGYEDQLRTALASCTAPAGVQASAH